MEDVRTCETYLNFLNSAWGKSTTWKKGIGPGKSEPLWHANSFAPLTPYRDGRTLDYGTIART
jgi:hypothetical protein